jgi:ParB family chromosome partitioning protein
MSDDPIIRISAARSEAAPGAAVKRPALGRGLGALLGDSRREEPLSDVFRAGGGWSRRRSVLAPRRYRGTRSQCWRYRRISLRTPSSRAVTFDEAALEELDRPRSPRAG